MGRQNTNYKRRAIAQIQEMVQELKASDQSPKLIKKLNKIKSTIEKIRYPQTKRAIKKQERNNESK